MYKPLPFDFAYLILETGPQILVQALKDHGLREVPGAANSPRIMEMASTAKARSYYHSDATPWCALGITAWAKQAGLDVPRDPLAAKSWAEYGTPVKPGQAMLGDVLVKSRVGGNHVCIYVGEYGDTYYCLGANQADQVCIVGYPKSVFTHIRRTKWKVAQPANVRKVVLPRRPVLAIGGKEA